MQSKKEPRPQENNSVNKVTSCDKNNVKVESKSNQHSSQPQTTPALKTTTTNDNNGNDIEKINIQPSTTEKSDSQQEITGGNCHNIECADEKINTTPKKRFFDLKRTAESATNKISSISPSRFSLNSLTPRLRRKSATNHKLSQLERQSNLFIRDGSENKINNPESLMSVAIENGAIDDNTKHQQTLVEGKVDGGGRGSKKVSLIPSFNFKIPSGSSRNLCKNLPELPNYEEIDVTDFQGNEETTVVDMDDESLPSVENVQEMLKKIPIRPRKGNIPHMENYCLFDPAVDFYDDKQIRRNNFAITDFTFPIRPLNAQPDKTVYDKTEHDERTSYHNYYEIDPDLLEQDEACGINPNTTKAELTSSSSSSSCDYPSIFTSVVETTPTSTIESTDENETIHFESPQNVINLSGTKKKSQPQLERIVHNKQVVKHNQCQTMNGKSMRINLQLFRNKADLLKSSHSLPQLENIGNGTTQQITANGCDYNVEINRRTATIQMRRATRKARPLSSDSGFTTPSPPNETSSSNQSQCTTTSSGSGNNAGNGQKVDASKGGRNESTVLNCVDNIQQLIEVSVIAENGKQFFGNWLDMSVV